MITVVGVCLVAIIAAVVRPRPTTGVRATLVVGVERGLWVTTGVLIAVLIPALLFPIANGNG